MRCLRCYLPTGDDAVSVHAGCARAVFGTDVAPRLSLPPGEVEESSLRQLGAGRGLTGVQRKFSGDLDDDDRRLLLGDVLAGYLIKPQTPDYPHLPEVEALSTRLADLAGLMVAPSTLLQTDEGELVYVTRRVDRLEDGTALRQEDMAQITERLLEHKYRGSHEQIAREIARHCAVPRLELVRYFRAVAFCFAIGNNDAHLKNWSLTRQRDGRWGLTPLYDLVAVRLVLPERDDPEELALALAGRKRKFTRANFLAFAATIGLTKRIAVAQLRVLAKAAGNWRACIRASYLPSDLQESLLEVLDERMGRLLSD